jgi:hypothetical protein
LLGEKGCFKIIGAKKLTWILKEMEKLKI